MNSGRGAARGIAIRNRCRFNERCPKCGDARQIGAWHPSSYRHADANRAEIAHEGLTRCGCLDVCGDASAAVDDDIRASPRCQLLVYLPCRGEFERDTMAGVTFEALGLLER